MTLVSCLAFGHASCATELTRGPNAALVRSSVMRTTVALLAVCFLMPACDDAKPESEAKQEEIKWPEKPADGSDISLELLEVQEDGAKFKVYNFSDKAVKQVSIRQRFLDDGGKELDTFPHMQVGTIEPKSVEEIKTVIMTKPEGMTTVEGVIRKVKYADGTEWVQAE